MGRIETTDHETQATADGSGTAVEGVGSAGEVMPKRTRGGRARYCRSRSNDHEMRATAA
jgi:hypothetical protein